MLTDDDERTLRVLEAVSVSGKDNRAKNWICAYYDGLIEQAKMRRGWGWQLTPAGRAELDRLRKLKESQHG